MIMSYESFVAYSCILIVVVITVSFLHWIEKNRRERKKLHEEFERERKVIEESIRRQRSMIEGVEIPEQPCLIVNDKYDPMKVGLRVAPHPKPKKAKTPKPEWWRFLTEESIGSLLEKRRLKKAEAEALKNDPWSS